MRAESSVTTVSPTRGAGYGGHVCGHAGRGRVDVRLDLRLDLRLDRGQVGPVAETLEQRVDELVRLCKYMSYGEREFCKKIAIQATT